MNDIQLYPVGAGPALAFALHALQNAGVAIAADPGPDVTHLLLPVPSLDSDGKIRGGPEVEAALAGLSEDVCIIGGNLRHPAFDGHPVLDLLLDPEYLAQNAAITAHCALVMAGKMLPVVFRDCPVLIVGWGRIGKCLAQQLKALGARVTVAARKRGDQAMITAFGCRATSPDLEDAREFRVIFNTAPAPVLKNAEITQGCLKIELASIDGLSGDDVVIARGLPGKYAPESSGVLIARTVLRLLQEKEVKE